jgi:Flp pilus assembly protein TadG
MKRPSPSRTGGQIVVVFALAIIAILAMASLVIDGGNVFAQQRIAQNGADATANAGTLVIAEKLSGAPKTGLDVYNAVTASATANGLQNAVALYTDNFGVPFDPPIVVSAATALPTDARGVHVGGDRVVGTTLARVIGITSLTASADATAIAGAASGGCPPDTSCGLLPVTFPVQVSECDGTGNLVIGTSPEWPLVGPANDGDPAYEAIVPLCKISEGAVGWLDLAPGNLQDEIVTPVNDFAYPSWVQTQPGNPNSVEDEININYADKVVLIPMFDGTCRIKPATGATPCPDADKGVDPVGNNTYYHIPYLAAFHLDQAYIQGANVNSCATDPGNPHVDPSTPGFLGCLKGWFVDYILPGEVNPTTTITDATVIAMQLIR